jgi:predicted flap endonuclease-1-like 5' DNA nuclease
MPPPSNTSVPPPLTNPRDNFRRIERLRNEVRGIKAIQGKHERDVLTLKGALEHLDKRFTAQQSMRSDDNVDGRLALLGARIARLETQTGVVPSDVMLGKLATLEERLSQLEARLAEAPAAAARATEVSEAGAPAITDIRGIGPKYAKALAKLGVRTPADVARWTPEDVEKAASALGIPATRIQKAGWIEQAQELEKKA